MRALRLESWKSEPVLTEVATPEPGPGEVLVQVGAAGACHSDLHLMHDFEPGILPWSPPFTLGHENAGWVHDGGRRVSAAWSRDSRSPWSAPGDAAGAPAAWPVWRRTARTRRRHRSRAEEVASASTAGWRTSCSSRPPATWCRSPTGCHPVLAAPLTDAGLTPYHAVRRSLDKLSPASTAVVIGVGGLGHLAVQILRAMTAAHVIAVDPKETALQLAKSLGRRPDAGPRARPWWTRCARRPTGTVPTWCWTSSARTAPWPPAAAVTRQLGDLTIVGIAGGSLPVSFFGLAYEASVQTTYWGNRSELVELLDLAARGLLTPEITTFPLDEAPEVYAGLAAGDITGRAVVVPSAEYTP